MRTKIISAFPVTGKSYFCEKYRNKYLCLDSDSSQFHKTGYDWPNNYMQYIMDHLGQVDFIFVSSHKVVREALTDCSLFFYLMYPYEFEKEEYMNRYRQRNNSKEFVNLMDMHYLEWVRECNDFRFQNCYNVIMRTDNIEEELKLMEMI